VQAITALRLDIGISQQHGVGVWWYVNCVALTQTGRTDQQPRVILFRFVGSLRGRTLMSAAAGALHLQTNRWLWRGVMIRDVAVLLQRVAVARAVNWNRLSERCLASSRLSKNKAVEQTRSSRA
jgi:hypothetical protein